MEPVPHREVEDSPTGLSYLDPKTHFSWLWFNR